MELLAPSRALLGWAAAFPVASAAAQFPPLVDLAQPAPNGGAVIWNSLAGEHAGSAVALVGDVDGDGRGDALIGVPDSDPEQPTQIDKLAGEAFVVYGDLAGALPDLILGATAPGAATRLFGLAAYSHLGQTLAPLGDFDGDGRADFAVGAPYRDAPGLVDGGAAFVVRGAALVARPDSIHVDPLGASIGVELRGDAQPGLLASSLAGIGDWNGDGFADLLAGAPKAQPSATPFVLEAGEAYVLYGSATSDEIVLTSGLDGQNGFQLEGVHSYGEAGTSVAGIGDVNADGWLDLAVSAPKALGGRGQVHVLYGGVAVGASGAVVLGAQSPDQGFTITGAQDWHAIGQSLGGGGDWNDDGVHDFAIGATRFGVDQVTRTGAAYVVFGRPGIVDGGELNTSQLDGTNGFIVRGSAGDDFFGASVALDGDLNGDGVSDLAVGAPGHDPAGRPAAGAAYAIFGRPPVGLGAELTLASLDGLTGFELIGAAAGDWTGLSVAFGRDDSDAVTDLCVGVPRASPAAQAEAGGLRTIRGTVVANPALPTLVAAAPSLHTGGGAELLLTLKAGSAHAGQLYLLLGSGAGTSPGIPTAAGVLPLVPDPYFAFTLGNPNSPLLAPSLAFLDTAGSASASFALPSSATPELAGLTVHHAFVALELPSLAVAFVSDATSCALVPYVAPPAPESTTRESLSTAGAQGDGASLGGTLTGNGRWLVFQSAASNLVDGAASPSGVYLRDREAGTTKLASVNLAGVGTASGAFDPWLSEDGRFVAFYSAGADLVAGDTNNRRDVFVRDFAGLNTQRVSVSSAGAQGNGDSTAPHISRDGRYVAFETVASNLVPADANGMQDIAVHDRVTAVTTLVSVSSTGVAANGHSSACKLSPDGRYVGFVSGATNLDLDDTQSSADIYLHDRVDHATVCISKKMDGQAAGNSFEPRVTTNGALVFFESTNASLVPFDTNGVQDVFVRNVAAGVTTRVSIASDGAQANGASYLGQTSADGRYVLIVTLATNLAAGTSGPLADLVVIDRVTNTRWVASKTHNGQPATAPVVYEPIGMSDDGRAVGFTSDALNFVQLDNNTVRDVFVHTKP